MAWQPSPSSQTPSSPSLSSLPEDEQEDPQPIFTRYPGRLGMNFTQRLLLADTSAFFCGFLLGSASAGRMAALRFRAENAHRLPTTRPGWYLYHKTKNYYKMKHGIVEGVKKGGLLAIWSTVFFLIEESVDVFRGTWRAGRTFQEMEGVDELDLGRMSGEIEGCRDFWSTGIAGIVTGGLWSAWNHFPANTAARTMRMGLLAGVGYGLIQDGLIYLRTNKVGYMENPFWKKVEEKRRKQDEEKAQKLVEQKAREEETKQKS